MITEADPSRVAIHAEQPAYAEGVPSERPRLHRLSRSLAAVRTIAVGRLILAAYWVLAFTLDPPETFPHEAVAYGLLYAFCAYALARVVVVCRAAHAPRHRQIGLHVLDLSVFAVLTFLTQGAASPFFLGFAFSLVCATLLFDMRGMLWTAGAALLIYVTISLITQAAGDFTLSRFIVRVGFLASTAALMIQLKRHDARLQLDYRRLAEWPRGSMVNLSAMLGEVLEHARRMLRVPRIIAVWGDAATPVLHVATASSLGVSVTEEPLFAFDPVVDRAARLKSFVSTKWLPSPAARSESASGGLRPLAANPINAAFREKFGIGPVMASRFSGETISGWFFALDKDDLTEDDLVLTDIVAVLVESRLEQFDLAASVRDNAVMEERIRCARDLHDGVLQSLSGTALHLHCLRHLIEKDPQAALFSLAEIEEALAADQREVRSYIMKLRTTLLPEDGPPLGTRLATLGERIQREWGLKVTVDSMPLIEIVSPAVAEEIYGVVKEALTNAAMHSYASRVAVEVTIRNERARIVVEDNGRGFAFAGRYTLSQLNEMRRGPVTLKERIAAIGGNLTLESKEGGVRLEIDLPLSLVAVAT